MAYRDYFSFESIRDKEGNVVCYHVTMIGTIEDDGVARIRTDLGENEDKKMAFGRLTIRGCNKKIQVLTNETNSRVYYHSYTPEEGPVDIISFAARDWRADEIYKFESGDRVLLEGRAYVRSNAKFDEEDPEVMVRLPEISVTVTGTFVLGRKRRPQRDFLPQEEHTEAPSYSDTPVMYYEGPAVEDEDEGYVPSEEITLTLGDEPIEENELSFENDYGVDMLGSEEVSENE